jgi:hypothetical protein
MQKKLKAHHVYLKHLSRLNASDIKAALKKANKRQVRCLCECVLNLLAGNISITPQVKRKLCRYKATLRSLADKRRKLASKKKILIQKGGNFLLALLPAAISAIASLIR